MEEISTRIHKCYNTVINPSIYITRNTKPDLPTYSLKLRRRIGISEMAGMLPGVEAARIRRCSQSNLSGGGGGGGSTRRSSFCLYATNYQEFRISSPSFTEKNPIGWEGGEDEKLDAAATEAKERLDQRLQIHCKIGTQKSKGNQKNKKFQNPWKKS